MKDYKTDYIGTAKKIASLTEDIISDDRRKDFVKTIEEKIETFQPSLMLYGTYNSGKSTLLNALYGEEKAKTGDSPETSKIMPYDWNGYIIYDTPGIDAPIKHEEVTEEQLRKTEIVLFVISNDGAFEERYIYEKMIHIVKLNKPLLIIMNNKAGIDPNKVEFKELLNTVSKWVYKIADEEGIAKIDSKFRLLWVDAEAAYNGKKDGQSKLIDYSNIIAIEQEINKILKKSDIGEVLKTLDNYIIDFIDNIIREVDYITKDKNAKVLEKQITELTKQKERYIIKLHNLIDKKTQILSDEIREKILAEVDQNDLNSYIDIELENLSSNINREIEEIHNRLIQNENDFSTSPEGIELARKIIHSIQNDEYEPRMSTDNKYINDIKIQLKQGLTNENLLKEVSLETFKLLREIGVKGFKWRWSSTLEKWANGLAKGLAPTMRFIFSIYQAYEASKEEERLIEKKRQFARQAQTEAEKISIEIKQELCANLDEVINSLYEPLIQKKTQQIEIIEKDTKTANKIKRELSEIRIKIKIQNI